MGKRVRGQLDASYGTIDQSAKVFSFTAGPRVNVVNMDRVQLGTFAGFGVRSIFESLQSDVQPITSGGISTDVLLSEGFLLWGQTSVVTKTPEDDGIGYAILSNHLSFGIGGRF